MRELEFAPLLDAPGYGLVIPIQSRHMELFAVADHVGLMLERPGNTLLAVDELIRCKDSAYGEHMYRWTRFRRGEEQSLDDVLYQLSRLGFDRDEAASMLKSSNPPWRLPSHDPMNIGVVTRNLVGGSLLTEILIFKIKSKTVTVVGTITPLPQMVPFQDDETSWYIDQNAPFVSVGNQFPANQSDVSFIRAMLQKHGLNVNLVDYVLTCAKSAP